MQVTKDRLEAGMAPCLAIEAIPATWAYVCAAPAGPDPLSEDAREDPPVLTTERRLRRLATVAADAGARFVRDGLPHDAAAWMQAPRRLFRGRTAIEACQERDDFVRATLLHGLSFGLDADPEDLDALIVDDPWDDGEDEELGIPAWRRPDDVGASPRLFTCLVEGRIGSGGRSVQALCAMVVADEEAARRRLRCRYGQDLGDRAEVFEGFAGERPLARQLLSDAMTDLLAEVALDPEADVAFGLDIQVERRFAL